MEEILDDVKKWYIDNKIKIFILGSIVSVILAVVLIYYMLFNQKSTIFPSTIESVRVENILETSSTQKWFVDVKGEVKNTGVYEVSEGMRVKDAVELAGGFNDNADKNSINLSQNLSDEMVIFVPSILDESKEILQGSSGKIKLNTASKAELMTIDGIGEKKAEAIISFREKVKRIKNFDELKEIKGFSQKIIDKIKESCVL